MLAKLSVYISLQKITIENTIENYSKAYRYALCAVNLSFLLRKFIR